MTKIDRDEQLLQVFVDCIYGPGHTVAEVLQRPRARELLEAIEEARKNPNTEEAINRLTAQFRRVFLEEDGLVT